MTSKPKRILDMTIRQQAEAIATDLMTSGNGELCERLLLWSDSKKTDAGGWSLLPLADRIEKWMTSEFPLTRQ